MKRSLPGLPGESQLLSSGRKRIRLLSALLLLPTAVLVGKMLLLQIAKASTVNFEKRTVLPAARGQLLAADGTSMAVTLDEYTVCANPRGVADKAKMAQLIADAQQAYASGQKALAAGDFAAYGEAQKQIDADLSQLAKLLGTPSPTVSPQAGGSPAPSAAPTPSATSG